MIERARGLSLPAIPAAKYFRRAAPSLIWIKGVCGDFCSAACFPTASALHIKSRAPRARSGNEKYRTNDRVDLPRINLAVERLLEITPDPRRGFLLMRRRHSYLQLVIRLNAGRRRTRLQVFRCFDPGMFTSDKAVARYARGGTWLAPAYGANGVYYQVVAAP